MFYLSLADYSHFARLVSVMSGELSAYHVACLCSSSFAIEMAVSNGADALLAPVVLNWKLPFFS